MNAAANKPAPLARLQLAGYGVFAFPLAMAALPVYLHAPRLYAESTALGLGTIGLLGVSKSPAIAQHITFGISGGAAVEIYR